jgi:hypothetical protein
VLDLAEPELHVVEAGRLSVAREVLPGAHDHLARHVHADHAAPRPDLRPRDEAVEAAAAAEIEDDLPGPEGRDRRRVPAREAEIAPLGQRAELLRRVADLRGARFGGPGTQPAAPSEPSPTLAYARRLADLRRIPQHVGLQHAFFSSLMVHSL